MTEIVIPPNTTVSFTPDAAGNIVQHNDGADTVYYSFANSDATRWFVLSPNNGTIRVDQVTYFKTKANRTVRLISDKV